MRNSIKILIGTAAALALLPRKKDGESTPEIEGEEESVEHAMTGYALSDVYEQELFERRPVDLSVLEDAEPMCGQFYQTHRGDTWLGEHPRSITYRALYRTAHLYASKAKVDVDPRVIASNPRSRHQLFELCVGQCWADEVYGTYLTSSRDPVGSHGRGIPIVRCNADNRGRIERGEAALRICPRGEPSNRWIGIPNRKTLHDSVLGPVKLSYPFVWLPFLNPEELLSGRVTTRGMRWQDGSTALEPPPEVVRLQIARLDHG